MVTLKDIAKEAGVSMMTVSRIVNGTPGAASEETTRRVLAVVKKRGYVPNASARALVSRNSRLIAACLLSVKGANPLEDPYNAQFLGALVNETRARGYDLMLRFVESFDEATRGIRSWNADGAVFNGLPDRHIRALEEQHPVPIVFTDCYTSARQVNCVGIDDTKGGRLAAAYLLSHGHRRFAFCGFYQAEEGVMLHRLTSFRETVRAFGGTLPEDLVFSLPRTEPQTALAGCAERLSAACARGEVTAAFVAADILAVDLIEALAARGVRVPEDLSIVGFDNVPLGAHIAPPLTTIAQDVPRKAKCAAEILFRHIEDPKAPAESITLDLTLVERGSVRTLS